MDKCFLFNKMMITFFESLKNFDYSSYSYLTNKFLSEKKIVTDLKKMNIANTRMSINYYRDSKAGINIFDLINNNSIKNLKPRTFEINVKSSNPNESLNNLIKEIVIYDDSVKCEKCKNKIEIGTLTVAFNEMNKGPQLKCPECKKLFSSKINVQFGKEVDNINLYSVYYLYTLSIELIKNYGNKINMDDLRSKYKDFFWNCIWYFRIQGLSFDMMLKYKLINYYNAVKDNNSNTKKKRFFNNLQLQRQSSEA